MDKLAKQPETERNETQVVDATEVVAPSGQPRNFLAVMLLLVAFGFFGAHKIYMGDKTTGWTRFGLGVAAVLLSPIFIGLLIYPVLIIWQVYDFFTIYLKNHTDAEGQPFVATDRDKKAAKVFFIISLVQYGLVALAIVGGLFMMMLGLFSLNNLQDSYNDQSSSMQRGYSHSYREYQH